MLTEMVERMNRMEMMPRRNRQRTPLVLSLRRPISLSDNLSESQVLS